MTGDDLTPEALLAAIAQAARAHHLFVSGTLELRASDLPEGALPSGAGEVRGKSPRLATIEAGQRAELSEPDPKAPPSATFPSNSGQTADQPLWLALLSAEEPGFWRHVTAEPEFIGEAKDPLDRWSRRAVGEIASAFGAAAVFPFGGPPWLPFLRWAEKSGRSFPSPVLLHVHDRMGLWASWRGALVLNRPLPPTQAPGGSPCQSCAEAPCKTACPAGAMVEGRYDLAACHEWLDRPQGKTCLTGGCLVRKACPVSRLYGRLPEESAHHMRHFHR